MRCTQIHTHIHTHAHTHTHKHTHKRHTNTHTNTHTLFVSVQVQHMTKAINEMYEAPHMQVMRKAEHLQMCNVCLCVCVFVCVCVCVCSQRLAALGVVWSWLTHGLCAARIVYVCGVATRSHTHTHTCNIRTRTHKYKDKHSHTQSHTLTHTHNHAHTHTNTLIIMRLFLCSFCASAADWRSSL
jgi:hypothetical protein